MAETKSDRPIERSRDERQREGQSERRGEQGLSRPQGRGLWRSEPMLGGIPDPFELMDRMSEEMERLFGRLMPFGSYPRVAGPGRAIGGSRRDIWVPRVEAFQQGDTCTIRAELPGLRKEDVDVELTDEAVVIRGERRDERKEEREGFWRSEREYGQFYRAIPLPDGVIAESAEARFRDGVLEIHMKAAPADTSRGRRLEIQDASSEQKKQ
jgi:HSP20 family protein